MFYQCCKLSLTVFAVVKKSKNLSLPFQIGGQPLKLQMGQKTVSVVGLSSAGITSVAGTSPVVTRVAAPSTGAATSAAGLVPITDSNMPQFVVVSRQNQSDVVPASQS